MFKDATTLDRQRTATSFTAAWRRYAEHAEDWFDGSVGSVDRRMTACNRLLHSANSTVGRLDIGVSRRYLQALTDLKTDHEALADLKYALLTGASGREDVTGPPGWRTASDHSLAGTDQRWVSLEAAKFLAANPDAHSDTHELATRAHDHVALKTSTFTRPRSAALCQAFVAKVAQLHRAAPRPRVASAAPRSSDFPDELMFLA